MSEIRNLTPHPLTLVLADRSVVYPRYDDLPAPRVIESVREVGQVESCPIHLVSLGEPTDLPEPEPGVVWVVSLLTCQAAPHRRDLVYPYPMLRDEAGRIIGAAGLGQVPPPKAGA